MERDAFTEYVKRLERDAYLNDEAREFVANLDIRVDESDGMSDPRREQPTIVSRSFSEANPYLDEESDPESVAEDHRETVRTAIRTTSDLQRYQVYDDRVIDHILIIEANYGMDAVAVFQ